MYNETFLKQYDSEKIQSWNNNYINYINLINQITNIIEKKNNSNQMNLELNEEMKKEEEEEEEILLDKEKANNIENSLEIDNLSLKSNDNNTSITKKMEKKYKKQTKDFMSILDKEIKKIHIFYMSKETILFKGINSQITIFNDLNQNNVKNNDENNNKKIEIISELNYLSKLAKSLIYYVYSNIKALKEILNTYDRKVIYISYKYIKKHLSKNNGDLVYILNFKVLDECIIAIQELFELVRNNLNKVKFFKNNKKKEEEFDNNNEQIIDNIQDIEEIHEKIFEELTKWEKHLNMSLGLPSSSYHSIFKETSFIGDSIPLPSEKPQHKFSHIKKLKNQRKTINLLEKEKNPSKIENITKIDENDIKNDTIDNNDNKNKILLENNKDLENNKIDNEEILEKESFDTSGLFANSEVYSYDTKKVLNKESIRNLHILLTLIFFYSFSVSYLIPNIILFLCNNIEDKDKDKEDKDKEHIYLYGIIISIPYIGNITAKIILKYFFNKAFKVILVLSLFFLLFYYALLLLTIIFNQIFFIVIGRFLLGFSILSHLSKIYVDNYIPLTTQIKTNQRHTFYINIGYFFGFLLNSLYFLDKKKTLNFTIYNFEFDIFKIIIIICSLFSFILLIVIIANFQEPTKYTSLHESLLKISQKHRLSKAFLNENIQKIDLEKLDQNYKDANTSFSSQGSNLSSFIQKHLNKKNYYSKLKLILIFFLISIEYTRENLILFIPRLISYNKDKDSNDYILLLGPCIIAFSFLFSYLLQKINLEKKRIQKKRFKILFLILLFLLFFNICFFFIVFPEKKDLLNLNIFILLELIPGIGLFCMIILNELFYIIVINLFIQLLPSEKIKFCCFKLSFALNFVTKIVRIIPSLIIFSFLIIYKDKFRNYLLLNEDIINNNSDNDFNYLDSLLFGIQIFNLLFSLLLLVFNISKLKKMSRNRLLVQ